MQAKHVRKALVAAATALTTLALVIPDGLTQVEIILVVLDALGAVGVYAVKNEPLP